MTVSKDDERLASLLSISGFDLRAESVLAFPMTPRALELVVATLECKVSASAEVLAWYRKIAAEEDALLSAKKAAASIEEHRGFDRLYSYQKEDVSYILAARNSILADEPGLGKTAVAAVASSIDDLGKALVLCPNSLKMWWYNELRAWCREEPRVVVVDAATRPVDIYTFLSQKGPKGYLIMNWDLLRLEQRVLGELEWDWIIADEAHRARNPRAQLTRAFLSLKAKHRLLITATPFSNNPTELWALLAAVKSRWHMTWDTFKDMYAYELYSVHGHPKYSSRIRNLPLLKREVAPYMIRHLKAEVGIQLPPKRAQRMPLFMLPEQVAAYRDAVRLMMIELSDGTILDIPNIVAKLTRLRQITSGLATIKLADGTPGPDISAKLDAAMELIEDRAGDPTVVFSMFRETIKALGRRLTKAGVPWSQIMAEMSSEEVSESKERFAQGDTKVMIGTIGVGGVGHTLTAADTLIFVDKHYNPDHQLQAEDRIHRIGQTRPCLIISLHVNHTVDDFVESIVTGKELMTSSLMTHSLRESLEDSTRFL